MYILDIYAVRLVCLAKLTTVSANASRSSGVRRSAEKFPPFQPPAVAKAVTFCKALLQVS